MAAWGQRSSITDWMPKAVAGNAAPAAPRVPGAGAALGQPNPFNNDPARNVGRDGGGLPVVGNTNPFGWTYRPGTSTIGQPDPTRTSKPSVTNNPPAPSVPPPAAIGHDPYTASNPYAGGPGAGVTVDAQGNVHLPNGMSLGQANSFTLNVNGQQVRVAGNYNGSNEDLWQVNGVGETAMDRFSRRMNDLARAGVNVSDPNVQYREMARVRDDAIYALTQRLGRPPTDQELQAATGFAHINNFVRGANGEPGYQAPPQPGQAPPPAAGSQAPPPTAGSQAPPPANGAQGGNQAPPAGGMQEYTNPVTGQKGSAALADIALMGNDADAVATRRALLMRGLGLDPTAQGLFYSSINKTLGDAMDRYLALQGIAPGTQYGTIQQNMRNFEGLVNSGDYYGGLTASADAARQALLNGGMNGLDAGTQFSVLNQVLGQRAEGLNPILAQAMANRASNARTTFGQQSIDRLNAGQGELTDPVAWLRNSPWADLLG